LQLHPEFQALRTLLTMETLTKEAGFRAISSGYQTRPSKGQGAVTAVIKKRKPVAVSLDIVYRDFPTQDVDLSCSGDCHAGGEVRARLPVVGIPIIAKLVAAERHVTEAANLLLQTRSAFDSNP